MADQDYLTAEEARGLLKVSRWKMAQLLDSGAIPYRQSDWDKRVKLIKRSDLLAWMEAAGPRPDKRKAEGGRAALAFSC
jgi:excisionase family DNA binding protein